MEKANIAVLGSGGFGLSLAVMMDKMGHDVTVWSKFKSELDDIRRDGENKAKLPGVKISESIKLTDDISCVTGKDLVILGIPVNFVRSVAKEAAPFISENTVVVNTGKGLEGGSLKFISEVVKEEIGRPIVVLTGPSHAEEVAIGMPTTVVVASETRKLMGVREDSRFGKQICVLSEDLKGTLEPNILYSVELKPMHKANGYVVVAATPVLFQAHVETVIVPKTLYQVTVTFGNKKIFFDPKDGKSVMSRTIDGVLEILKGRKDIKYKEGVITDYLNQARALVRRMESDGFIYTGDRHQGGIQ